MLVPIPPSQKSHVNLLSLTLLNKYINHSSPIQGIFLTNGGTVVNENLLFMWLSVKEQNLEWCKKKRKPKSGSFVHIYMTCIQHRSKEKEENIASLYRHCTVTKETCSAKRPPHHYVTGKNRRGWVITSPTRQVNHTKKLSRVGWESLFMPGAVLSVVLSGEVYCIK